MFHRDCFQILSLNFRSSTETVSREDPQIDFCHGNVSFALEGGGGGGGVTRTFLKSQQQSIFQAEKLMENSCQYGRILYVT